MKVEAILSRDDLVHLVSELTPVAIPLGEQGDLFVSDPSEVTLVPDVGLRVVCKAKLRWPVLGFDVPVTLKSLTVLLRPEIVNASPAGDALVFKLDVEHADLAGIPAMIDARITEKVNKELALNKIELTWNFARTLSHAFKLRGLPPIDELVLHVSGGHVKVTREALALDVSFQAKVTRNA